MVHSACAGEPTANTGATPRASERPRAAADGLVTAGLDRIGMAPGAAIVAPGFGAEPRAPSRLVSRSAVMPGPDCTATALPAGGQGQPLWVWVWALNVRYHRRADTPRRPLQPCRAPSPRPSGRQPLLRDDAGAAGAGAAGRRGLQAAAGRGPRRRDGRVAIVVGATRSPRPARPPRRRPAAAPGRPAEFPGHGRLGRTAQYAPLPSPPPPQQRLSNAPCAGGSARTHGSTPWSAALTVGPTPWTAHCRWRQRRRWGRPRSASRQVRPGYARPLSPPPCPAPLALSPPAVRAAADLLLSPADARCFCATQHSQTVWTTALEDNFYFTGILDCYGDPPASYPPPTTAPTHSPPASKTLEDVFTATSLQRKRKATRLEASVLRGGWKPRPLREHHGAAGLHRDQPALARTVVQLEQAC